jgi:hypothetical protein
MRYLFVATLDFNPHSASLSLILYIYIRYTPLYDHQRHTYLDST